MQQRFPSQAESSKADNLTVKLPTATIAADEKTLSGFAEASLDATDVLKIMAERLKLRPSVQRRKRQWVRLWSMICQYI